MSNDTAEQIARFVETLDREYPSITVDELVELSASDLLPTPRRRPSGWLVASAAALAVILVVGGLALLVNAPGVPAPAATTVATTPTIAEVVPSTVPEESSAGALPKADGTVEEMAGSPGVFSGAVGPLGPVSIEQTTSQTTFIPQGRVYSADQEAWTRVYGGLVETPGGYTALGVTTGVPEPALATSSDGVEWQIIEFAPDIPNYTFGVPARLFEAGGWYWIGLNEPYIYRSPDSINWEKIGLGGSTPGPLGGPVADQRWHEFNGRLVAATGEALLVVDMDEATVETIRDVPWDVAPDGHWSWMTSIDGKLTFLVSSVPDTPLAVRDPMLEQYETADLRTWTGPFRPAVTTDETTGLLMHGDGTKGITAIEVTGNLHGARRFFSADGLAWRGAVTLDEAVSQRAWSVVDQHLAPIRVNGRQGLVYQPDRRELHLSADGVTWQVIRLQNGEQPTRDSASLTTLGNRIFYYEHRSDTGPWQLDSWIVAVGE